MLRIIQKTVAPAAHVLSICDDDGLRFSRELLLMRDGYKTESIQSNTALTDTWIRSFDLALICRSVNRDRAIALVETLRRHHPGIQILAIRPLDSSPDLCDADLEVPSGPPALLNAIRSFLHQRTHRAHCDTTQAV
jgi:DNA-binding NtrC family response regulator